MSDPAFPVGVKILRHKDGELYKETVAQPGLTKRELFAAFALQALIAKSPFQRDHAKDSTTEEAVSYADALLAAIENPVDKKVKKKRG